MSENARNSRVAIRLYHSKSKGIIFNIHVAQSVTSDMWWLSFMPVCNLPIICPRQQIIFCAKIFLTNICTDSQICFFTHLFSFCVSNFAFWCENIFQYIFKISEAELFVSTSVQANVARRIQPTFCFSYWFLLSTRSYSVAFLGISKLITTSILFPHIFSIILYLQLSQRLQINGILLTIQPTIM